MTEQRTSDDLEIEVVKLIDRLNSGSQIGTWPMPGAVIVRAQNAERGRVLAFSKDGGDLRVMAEFEGKKPSLYKLGSDFFSRVVVFPETEVPPFFADLAERRSERIQRELEEQRKLQLRKQQMEREKREQSAEKERYEWRLATLRSRIQELETLSEDDITFLASVNERELIAEHFENRFHRYSNFATARKARDMWEEIKRFERGFLIIETAIDTKWGKQNESLWTMRGATLRRLGLWDEAIASCNRAIKLNPNSHHPYNTLGGIYSDQGLTDKADKYFERAIELGSEPQSRASRSFPDIGKVIDQRKIVQEFLRKRK